VIKLENVSKTYRTDKVETLALKDINLHVKKGDFLSIMGPSGCGKSTLLNVIGLLDQPGSGQIHVDGAPIRTYKDREVAALRNKTFGFIFQSFHLIQDLSALDNVELPLLYRKMSAGERKRRAQAALERVGLSARMEHYPNQLSGGQQQRGHHQQYAQGEGDAGQVDGGEQLAPRVHLPGGQQIVAEHNRVASIAVD
jgi:putative ABC transport system ATP-binding protein